MGHAVLKISYGFLEEILCLKDRAKIVFVGPVDGMLLRGAHAMFLVEGDELPKHEKGKPYPFVEAVYQRKDMLDPSQKAVELREFQVVEPEPA